MEATVEMAGYIAAHAMWTVAEGDGLTPMLAEELPSGRRLDRLVADRAEEAVAHGRRRLASNDDGATRAVLVFDGYVTLPDGRTDALLIEARRYGPTPTAFTMAVPYRNAAHPEGFRIYRPKFISCDAPGVDYAVLADAFFRGVDAHGPGSAVWARHIDQSR